MANGSLRKLFTDVLNSSGDALKVDIDNATITAGDLEVALDKAEDSVTIWGNSAVDGTGTARVPVVGTSGELTVSFSGGSTVDVTQSTHDNLNGNFTLQIADVDAPGGAGAVSASTPRMTLASDDPAVALLTTIDADTSNLDVALSTVATEVTASAILADTANIDTNMATVAGAVSGTEMQVDVVSDSTQGTQDAASVTTGPQIMLESKDFDNSVLPNNVDTEGDSVRAAGSLYGVSYTMPVNEFGNKTPLVADEDALPATPGMFLIGGEYRSSPTTYTDGDAALIRMDNNGRAYVKPEQNTHDNLNLNANIQVGDTDVSNSNPVPTMVPTTTKARLTSAASYLNATSTDSVDFVEARIVNGSTAQYIQVWDANDNTDIAGSGVLKELVYAAANETFSIGPTDDETFTRGIVVAGSSTALTYTAGQNLDFAVIEYR